MYYNSIKIIFQPLLLLTILVLYIGNATADVTEETNDALIFDDKQLEESIEHPEWFKLSLGDLRDDLAEAKEEGKESIIVYFGQQRCAYCKQFFDTSLEDIDIQNYLRKHYDIVALDIWSSEDIIDTDGKKYSERELAIHYKTNFTPSLVFYNHEGKPVFRLRGFYPPYKFRAALQYVTEGFYIKETFPEYLERANPGDFFLLAGLNERDFFIKPPHDINALIKNKKTTAVFFEQGNCHACDLLHAGPLSNETNIHELEKLNVVQLNMWADTPVILPSGSKSTAKDWAKSLNIFYTPSIIFFDESGKEIIRVDSVTQFYRLWGVLDYVNREGYKHAKNYQDWRLKQRKIVN